MTTDISKNKNHDADRRKLIKAVTYSVTGLSFGHLISQAHAAGNMLPAINLFLLDDVDANAALIIIQSYAVNSDASALTIQQLVNAGVVGATLNNLALYMVAISASTSIADLAELQLFVDNVNGLAGAEIVNQGGSSNNIALVANGSHWISIDNGYANHQIRVTTVDDIDVKLDIFYPGYRGIEAANFSYNDQPQGVGTREEHDTRVTEVLPDGINYFRITELSGNAGLFNFHDSD